MANDTKVPFNSRAGVVRIPHTLYGVAVDTATPPVNATAIDFRGFAGGAIHVAASIASVTFTYYGCDTESGTYVPLYNTAGAALTTTLPGGAAAGGEIPAACFAWPWIKITSNADDAETITVHLKS